MIIYSITYNVEADLECEWMDWIKEIHIPRIMRSRRFTRYTLQQLIDPVEEGKKVFNLQFHAEKSGDLDQFLLEDAEIYLGAHDQRFGEQVYAFDTIMERQS